MVTARAEVGLGDTLHCGVRKTPDFGKRTICGIFLLLVEVFSAEEGTTSAD